MTTSPSMAEVSIQTADFDSGRELERLQTTAAGAVASFVGTVRSTPDEPVVALELEHYAGMAERTIAEIVDEARRRWQIAGVRVIHRVGRLAAGERIVFVGVAAPHRGDAFAACEFIMDYLKSRAPLWKKAVTATGAAWLESRERDGAAAARWKR